MVVPYPLSLTCFTEVHCYSDVPRLAWILLTHTVIWVRWHIPGQKGVAVTPLCSCNFPPLQAKSELPQAAEQTITCQGRNMLSLLQESFLMSQPTHRGEEVVSLFS